jgi:hypothetical protein
MFQYLKKGFEYQSLFLLKKTIKFSIQTYFQFNMAHSRYTLLLSMLLIAWFSIFSLAEANKSSTVDLKLSSKQLNKIDLKKIEKYKQPQTLKQSSSDSTIEEFIQECDCVKLNSPEGRFWYGIYSVQGMLIEQGICESKTLTIDKINLGIGAFIIKISNSKTSNTYKFDTLNRP